VPWNSITDCSGAGALASWRHVGLHYHVLKTIVLAAPATSHFAQISYARRVFGQFDAPDMNERSALAELLLAIGDTRPSLRGAIARLALDCTVDYIERQRSAYAVAPALIVAGEYLATAPLEWAVPLYCRYILPLFGAVHYDTFHGQMARIVEFFHHAVPEVAAPVTIQALLLRFPNGCVKKSVEFLRLLSSAFQSCPIALPELWMMRALSLLARCLDSGHIKVAVAAAEIWGLHEIESVLRAKAREVLTLVYPLLLRAQKSWTPSIVDAIGEVFMALHRASPVALREFAKAK
jgi:hypothetical protein